MRNTLFAAALLCCGCATHYQPAATGYGRILVDSTYDAHPDARAAHFLAPYKAHIDSIMGPVVGRAAKDMNVYRPESELSNLMSDILVWAGKCFNERPDFAVYNMGGIRAAISKGNITRGDVLDVAPFENKLCFLTLSGADVMELFAQIARQRGEGVSHGVQLVITKDGQLVSATLNGREIDPTKDYRIATLDYVAQGNNGMTAFKKKRDTVSPQSAENNVREYVMLYFQELQAAGREADASVEGRVVVKN